MKATGIVRRIDELGRVVIPKEIRRTLKIKEGEPLEIFTSREGEIIFKKYSPLGDIESMAKACSTALYEEVGNIVVICDREVIISSFGSVRESYDGKHISDSLENFICEGKTLNAATTHDTMLPVRSDDGDDDYVAEIICPIKSEGGIIGAVVILSQKPGVEFGEKELKAAAFTANILSKYAE